MAGRTPDNEFRALASLVMAEDGLCFGIAFGLYGIRLWRLYFQRKTALARVEVTPVTSPADVAALLRTEEHDSESSGRQERRRWFKISRESASESSSSAENRDTAETAAIKSASASIGGTEVASRGPPFVIVEGVARPVDPVGFSKFMAKEEIGPWLVSDTTLSVCTTILVIKGLIKVHLSYHRTEVTPMSLSPAADSEQKRGGFEHTRSHLIFFNIHESVPVSKFGG